LQKANKPPLDVNEFRAIVRQESARLRLRLPYDNSEQAFTLALALSVAVKKIFYAKSKMKFSDEPVMEKKVIVKYNDTMRVDAMEKFNATTIFSVVEFAASEEALKRQEYILTLVVFLGKEFLAEFLALLQYPYLDFDDDFELQDGCGTLVNLIAGQYKKEMAALKYKDLSMTSFESYINSASRGIDVPKGSIYKYEISFEIEGVKRLVVEVIPSSKIYK